MKLDFYGEREWVSCQEPTKEDFHGQMEDELKKDQITYP